MLERTYVAREELAAERDDERHMLLRGRLTSALMRLNQWMTEDQAQRVIFNLQHLDETGLARNQAIHEYLALGMPLTVDHGGRQETPTVRFFDFDHPEPGVGLNEYVVTTQFRVRRGSERGARRASEDDERVVKPDLVLFVDGIPLVVMEAKAPTLLEVCRPGSFTPPRFEGRGSFMRRRSISCCEPPRSSPWGIPAWMAKPET